MADIKLKDLSKSSISGSNLFDDSENFMVELSDESSLMGGGIFVQTTPDVTVPICTGIGSVCVITNRCEQTVKN